MGLRPLRGAASVRQRLYKAHFFHARASRCRVALHGPQALLVLLAAERKLAVPTSREKLSARRPPARTHAAPRLRRRQGDAVEGGTQRPKWTLQLQVGIDTGARTMHLPGTPEVGHSLVTLPPTIQPRSPARLPTYPSRPELRARSRAEHPPYAYDRRGDTCKLPLDCPRVINDPRQDEFRRALASQTPDLSVPGGEARRAADSVQRQCLCSTRPPRIQSRAGWWHLHKYAPLDAFRKKGLVHVICSKQC